MRIRFVFGFIGVGLLLLATVGDRPHSPDLRTANNFSHEKMARDASARSEYIMKVRRYQSMIYAYKKVLGLSPESKDTKGKLSNAYFQLGSAHYSHGDLAKAKNSLEASMNYNSENSEAKGLLNRLK